MFNLSALVLVMARWSSLVVCREVLECGAVMVCCVLVICLVLVFGIDLARHLRRHSLPHLIINIIICNARHMRQHSLRHLIIIIVISIV